MFGTGAIEGRRWMRFLWVISEGEQRRNRLIVRSLVVLSRAGNCRLMMSRDNPQLVRGPFGGILTGWKLTSLVEAYKKMHVTGWNIRGYYD
jgi:hypothetical protein